MRTNTTVRILEEQSGASSRGTSTRRSNWLILLAVGLLVLLASYAWGRRTASTRPAAPDRAASALKTADSARARVGGARVTGAAEELDVAQQRAARSAFLDELSHRADSEAADPQWSHETEATITRVISKQLGPAVSVAAVTCGSTICRAQLSHPGSPRIPDDKFIQFTLHRESLGSMEIQLDVRAERSTTLYFVRRATSTAVSSRPAQPK